MGKDYVLLNPNHQIPCNQEMKSEMPPFRISQNNESIIDKVEFCNLGWSSGWLHII